MFLKIMKMFFPFSSGEREKTCRVKLMGDHIHEQEEEFCLVLGSPFSPTLKQALIGPQNITHVKLTDLADSKNLVYLIFLFYKTSFSMFI